MEDREYASPAGQPGAAYAIDLCDDCHIRLDAGRLFS